MTHDETLPYQEQLQAWQRARFAPPPEPPLDPITPSIIARVPMRDGVHLYTEIFLPDPQGCFPVILMRSPYPYTRPSRNGNGPVGRYLQAGYALVFQITRGQYQSEGTFRFHLDDRDDGYDCINWLAEQSWCDGNVGMQGASYLGKVQMQAAHSKPAALKCIMPTALVGNFVRAFPFIGGVPARGWWLQWQRMAEAESIAELDVPYGDMSVLQHPVWGPALRSRPLIDAADGVLSGDKLASWRDTMMHPLDDDYWQPAHSTDAELSELTLPMFFTDGWYDLTIGPIELFTRLQALHPDNNDLYLLVGPWNHYQTGSSDLHDQDLGARKMPVNGGVDLIALRLAFFDRYLKGESNRNIQADRVRVFITGLDEWRNYPTFPVPGTTHRKLYLHSQGDARSYPGDGVLNWDTPGAEPADSYVYDPSLPTPAPPASLAEPVQDYRDIEIRGDVLSYTSAPLDAPLTILGDIVLILHAASDGLDTDWFATVTEVFPDGRSIPFYRSIGALRARYWQGFEREVLLTPNTPTEFRIPLGPAGHQLVCGSRLRLSLCSAYFPDCDPNTNTGNPVTTDTELRIAQQTVFHDAARPSHIVVPVIDG